jgi:uncharacterized protein YbjT (DUF2867 family)
MAVGWHVRGTSRGEEGLASIQAAGIEPALADPIRPGTVLELVEDVSVIYWLLGLAEAEPEVLAAIHGSLLQRTLERLVETPVRGFVYESPEDADLEVLERGEAIVRGAGIRWRIPVAVVAADPGAPRKWAREMVGAALSLLETDLRQPIPD